MAEVQKTLVTVFANPGGEGKTTIVRSLDAMARLRGVVPELVCADAGNGAIRQVLPDSGGIDWGAKPEIGAKLIQHYADKEMVIIDCGANSSSKAFDLVGILAEARAEADRQQRKSIAIIPVSPNKPGAIGVARASLAAFDRAGFTSHIVLNNRDGTGDYIGEVDANWSTIPHLHPGFISVLNRTSGSWADLLRSPPEGYAMAVCHVAHWLQTVSTLPPISDCFDLSWNCLEMPQAKKLNLMYTISRLADASDKALGIYQALTPILRELETLSPDDPRLPGLMRSYQAARR